MTYAIAWRENEGSSNIGRLELGSDGIFLFGSGAGRQSHREVQYDRLTSLSVERRSLAGDMTQPTLVLVTADAERIEIASLEGLGALHELAEHVEGARGTAAA